MPSVVGVIPVRWNSKRWPGKALEVVQGRTLVEWAHISASQATRVDAVYIATDDTRIEQWAVKQKIACILTRVSCRNGTERVSEVANLVDADYYVNVQADQVGLEPTVVDELIELITSCTDMPLATIATTVEHANARYDRDTVFVRVDEKGYAAEFVRGGSESLNAGVWHRHLGVYAYTRSALFEYETLEPTHNEQRHELEQLRALEAGWPIGVLMTSSRTTSYDRRPSASMKKHC